MDRTLVIYDLTGRVLSIIYGATADQMPQGVPCVWCDIPAGAIIDHVNPVTKEVVFEYLPETDIGQLERYVKNMADFVAGVQGTIEQAAVDASDASATAKVAAENASSANTLAEGNATDITNIQVALAEVYETLLGGLV